jgi:integrase
MPYKRNDSPIYWASYTDPSGKRVRRSTGTADRREAAAIEAKWKLEAHEARTWGREPDRSIEEVMLAFLRAGQNRRAIETAMIRARHWRRLLPNRTLQGLKPADVQGYIVQRQAEGASNSTVNREMATLQAAVNWCNKAMGWGLPNPLRGRFLPEPEGRMRWLSFEEAERLLSMARKSIQAPYLPDFLSLALNTGMRRGEMLGLDWGRVDLQRRVITLEAKHTKTGKRRSVPLNDTARAALINRARFRAEHCPDSPWVFCNRQGVRIANIRGAFETARIAAGIEDFHIHDLRHTCAAWLVTAGVPLPEVRDLLGHASVTMTERYAHLSPENVRAAVERLDGLSRFGHADHFEDDIEKARKA